MPAKRKAVAEQPGAEAKPVQISARISPALAKSLRRAAFTRKEDGREPYTSGGIIEAALIDWLKREGFSPR